MRERERERERACLLISLLDSVFCFLKRGLIQIYKRGGEECSQEVNYVKIFEII
jgi:hypothetical protein